ncbi:MAG: ROK family protein [Pirellulaceae bacterium]|nr:ROK family protein [Pirellulaceae bacterium]
MNSLLAGIDLGATTIKIALAESNGRLVAQEIIPTESHAGPDVVLSRICGAVDRMRESQNASLDAIGMGVPGLVDVLTGVTKFLPNLETQWRDVEVGAKLSQCFGCSTRVLNDARAATLAELKFGHGTKRPDTTLAFFSVGTGIGGGVVIAGRLLLGPMGTAGELGHQTIVADGPRCGCGNHGCLETLASGPAIEAEGQRLMQMGLAPKLHELVDGNAERVDCKMMVTAANAGDESVAEAIDRAARFIGIAAANVVTILHPDMIVLGGGVAEIGDRLIQGVSNQIRQRVGMFPADKIQVVRSQLGEKAGLLGSVALAISVAAQDETKVPE